MSSDRSHYVGDDCPGGHRGEQPPPPGGAWLDEWALRAVRHGMAAIGKHLAAEHFASAAGAASYLLSVLEKDAGLTAASYEQQRAERQAGQT